MFPNCFLGKPDNSDLYKKLTSEAEDFRDILLEDFHDTYLNLTLKADSNPSVSLN
jgi:hypothetical protein